MVSCVSTTHVRATDARREAPRDSRSNPVDLLKGSLGERAGLVDDSLHICIDWFLVGVSPVASGLGATVVWAVDARGNTAARSFFNDLTNGDRAKIQALFNRLATYGEIRTRERFKKLDTRHGVALWEFKSFQIRFIGAFLPNRRPREFVVAHGLRKKKDRHSAGDLERAVRIIKEHVKRHGR